jgi:hypothetical protein
MLSPPGDFYAVRILMRAIAIELCRKEKADLAGKKRNKGGTVFYNNRGCPQIHAAGE